MKKPTFNLLNKSILLILGMSLFLSFTLYAASPVRIMPLGDSLTFDNYLDDTRPDNIRTGYRSHLWYLLDDGGYYVDFVGSVVAGDAVIPSFDPDNEGHPGRTDGDIANVVYGFLVDNPADIVLLHIGTNWVDSSPDEVETILNEIDRYENNYGVSVKVVLAKIINRKVYDPVTTAFNTNVESMALSRIGDDIVIVDMENGAGIDYATEMRDTWHPYDSGYQKMADLWYSTITPFLSISTDHYLKLDETLGSPYKDFYGNADGTCSGSQCPTAVTGVVGGAQLFDGIDDEVTITNTATFDWTKDDSFTIEFWLKTNKTDPADNMVIIGREGSGDNHWWAGTSKDTGQIEFALGDSSGDINVLTGGPALHDGQWHHIACVRDGSTKKNKIYVDGAPVAEITHTYNADFTQGVPVNIGYLNYSASSHRYTGGLDEVFVYAKALSDAEIQVQYLDGYNGGGPIPPVITLIGANPLNLELGDAFVDPGATATDNLDGDVTASIQVSDDVDTSTAGTYSVIYTVTDSNGNTAATSRSVVVTDPVAPTIPPVITLIGDNPLSLDLGDIFSDPGATATDNLDGDVTAFIQVSGNVDTTVVGTYSVTYTVTDSNGNTATASRSVVVTDPVAATIPPVITLIGDNPLNLDLDDTFSDPGATATDNLDGDVTASIQVSDNVDTSAEGTYSVTYTVTDSNGNIATASRSVVVTDPFPPVAVADSYAIRIGELNEVSASSGVLSNDFSKTGMLSAVLVKSPSEAISFTLNSDGSFSYKHSASFDHDDSFTYKVYDGTTYSKEASVELHTISAADNTLEISPTYQLFTLDTIRTLSVVNSSTESVDIGTIAIAGMHADAYFIHNDNCSNQTVASEAECTFDVYFNTVDTDVKSAYAAVPTSSTVTPVLRSFLYSAESIQNESLRRMPPVLYDIEIPETMVAGNSYTISWKVMAYNSTYLTDIVLFSCDDPDDGTCGSSYETHFNASGYLTPEMTENAEWTYEKAGAKFFSYSYTFMPDLEHFDVDKNMVLRFYGNSKLDFDAGKSGVSLLLPGNLDVTYYDNSGRRIQKLIKAQE